MQIARFERMGCWAIALLAAPLALASDWMHVGPSTGTVKSLAHDAAGGVLYAGVYAGGIFKSADAGASWVVAAPAIRGESVNALALHPAAPRPGLNGV